MLLLLLFIFILTHFYFFIGLQRAKIETKSTVKNYWSDQSPARQLYGEAINQFIYHEEEYR